MELDDTTKLTISQFRRDLTERDIDLAAALTTMIASVPLLGTYVNAAIKGRREQRIYERVHEMCEMLKQDMEKLEETKFDKAALESDEFQSVLLTVLRSIEV